MPRLSLLAVFLASSVAWSNARAADEHKLLGVSEWEAEPAHAENAADERIRAAAPGRFAATLGADLTRLDVARLLNQPGVSRHVQLERRERAYGEVWRASIEVTIPNQAVAAWQAKHSAERTRRRLVLFARVLLSVLVVGGVIGGARLWDRRTRGYARQRIGWVACPLFVVALTTIWLIG